ncbi:hypothetical protein [Aneurinibacillus sp. REN35]|uniref:hypothetical protein n=1 Tax=Aneurinibacillus sp. REN35 TaxID=3237286 RepID=UPI003528D185
MRQKVQFFVAGVLALSLGSGQGAAFVEPVSSKPSPNKSGPIPSPQQQEEAKQLAVQAMRNQTALASFRHNTTILVTSVYTDGKKEGSTIKSTGEYTKKGYHETSQLLDEEQEPLHKEIYYADSHLYMGSQEKGADGWQWKNMKTPQDYAVPAFEANVLPFPFSDVSQLRFTQVSPQRIAFHGQRKDQVPASLASVTVEGTLTLDASKKRIVQACIKEKVMVNPNNKKAGPVRETITDRDVSFYDINEAINIEVPQEAKNFK